MLMLDNPSLNLRSPYWAVTRLAEKRVQDYNRGLEGLGAGNLIFQKILIIKASLHRFRGGMFLRGNVIKYFIFQEDKVNISVKAL